MLAVVPARGGSKGLPGKNLALLAGLPLVVHALRLAALCPEIARTVVSTDAEEIAEVARAHGGEAPFLRPVELAGDATPLWAVLRHTLDAVDREGATYDRVLVLMPSTPFRLPADVTAMNALLEESPGADGVVSVSDPGFEPVWLTVVERDGRMEHVFPDGARYERRQDVPRSLTINGALYLWRAEFVRREPANWFAGRNRLYEMPRGRVADIDEPWDLQLCEVLLASGLVALPWLDPESAST